MKTKVLCIIGQSGSGKDTLASMLLSGGSHHIVVSNTTRPIREGEVNGREHNFLQECNMTRRTKVAYTIYGGYQYWTLKSDFKEDKINIYIIDERGYYAMRKRFGDREFNIRVCYIRRKQKQDITIGRIRRDIGREKLDPEDIDYFVDNRSTLAYLQLKAARINKKLSEWI